MNRETLLTLVAYDAYANQLVFDVSAKLTADEFKRVVGYLSVHDTLVHLLAAEAIWFARVKQTAHTPVLKPTDFPTLTDIRLYYDDLAAGLREMIANASEDDFKREIHYKTLRGDMLHFPMGQMLLHMFNHSTNHRGELSIMLTQLGHPLPDLDLTIYLRKASGQA